LAELDFTFLVVDVLCKAPLFGWILGWVGNMQGADAKNFKSLMETGANIAFVPGGFEEATHQKYWRT
jgi:hypothetical protein